MYHATDICDGCAQGYNGMNIILASREALCDMAEALGMALPGSARVTNDAGGEVYFKANP